MNLNQITYDMCRYYLNGLTNQITESEKLQILGWIRSQTISKLSNVTTELGNAFANAERLRSLMQIEAFFSKNELFESENASSTARANFAQAESKCRITNKRLDFYESHPSLLRSNGRYGIDQKDVAKVRREVAIMLGDFEGFFNKIPTVGYVSGGATCDLPRRLSQPFNKVGLRGKITCTQSAAPYILALAKGQGYTVRPKIVPGNRITFVPKNWKTQRTIACEPSGNCFLQLAFDQCVKRRLLSFGVDLRDQSKNQSLAREGAISGTYSTIDLKMASDTLAFNTVWALLPYSWAKFLSDVRSKVGFFASSAREFNLLSNSVGDMVDFAKFSSMGNGATFVLETLIFTAIVRACGASSYAVYGDDLVVPTDCTEKVLRVLRYFGFAVNPKKTFTAGPFRESCGVNYFGNVDVTPIYVRWKVRGIPGLCHYVNSFGSISESNPTLSGYLWQIFHEFRLPKVPVSETSTEGVWFTPRYCFSNGVIRKSKQVLIFKDSDFQKRNGFMKYVIAPEYEYRALVQKTKTRSCYDSKALYLWYLNVRDREMNLAAENLGYQDSLMTLYKSLSYVTTTSVTVPCEGVFQRKYVRYVPSRNTIRAVCFDEIHLKETGALPLTDQSEDVGLNRD